MCLAVPAKVIEKKDMVATVEVEGIRRDISLMLLPEANEGDYILMHAGFAIQVIDEEEAKITTELLKEVLGTNEPASETKRKQIAAFLLKEIDRLIDRPVRIMEVCGTHTVSIFRAGIRQLLPEKVELVSGPGCPVCVTPNDYLDTAIAYARQKDVIIYYFWRYVKGTRYII